MTYVVDEEGDVFEVRPSGTYREAEEGVPAGKTREATEEEVAAFVLRRVKAWEKIIETLPLARSILHRAGLTDEQEYDVAIPAIARAWRKFDPDRGEWRGFIRRVLWHDLLSAWRRVKIVTSELHDDIPEPGEREVPDVVYILDKLSEQDRSLLLLRFWGGLKLDEIASVMGFVKSGAWLRVKRAVERAREVVYDEERRSDVRRGRGRQKGGNRTRADDRAGDGGGQ